GAWLADFRDISGPIVVSCLYIAEPGGSSRDGQPDVGGVARRNHPAAGKDLAHVVEHDHSVAQQAPSLLGMRRDSAGRVAVSVVSRGARRSGVTPSPPPVLGAEDVVGLARAVRCTRDALGAHVSLLERFGQIAMARVALRTGAPRP